jgi:hypothetical protein
MKRILLLLAMVACAATALAQRGALTIPRNLDQLTARSADIVRGTMISARVEQQVLFRSMQIPTIVLVITQT